MNSYYVDLRDRRSRLGTATGMHGEDEGTMRLHGRVLNIESSGHVYDLIVEKVINGKRVQKRKPNPAKFEPSKSRWHDVTDRAPWGAGARMPLIPFRTLACNGTHEPRIPSIGPSQGGSACRVMILDMCAAAKSK